MKLPNPEDLYI